MLGREFIQPPRNAIIEVVPFLLVYSSGICASLLPDYISLWKTRYLMILGRATESVSFHFWLLTTDIFLTFCLLTVLPSLEAYCCLFLGSVATL